MPIDLIQIQGLDKKLTTSGSGGNPAFEVALKELSKDLEPAERRAFFDAYQHITPEQTLMTIKNLDEQDSETIARRGSRSLEPTIRILNQFMAGVSIGIQQSPEISSLVVGGVRLIIDVSLPAVYRGIIIDIDFPSLSPNLSISTTD